MTDHAKRPEDADDEKNKKEQNTAGEHPPHQEQPAGDIDRIQKAAAHNTEKGKLFRSLLNGLASGLVRGVVGELPIDLPFDWSANEDLSDD